MKPTPPLMSGTGLTGAGTALDWNSEDSYWRTAFPSRPYATTDLGYEYYQPAFRFGFESATRYRGKRWSEVELDVQREWDQQHHGARASRWEDVKQAVKDAWDHAAGPDDGRPASARPR
jgi:hypothetical protein